MLDKLIEHKTILLTATIFILVLSISVFTLKNQKDEDQEIGSMVNTLKKNDQPLILEKENFSEESLGYNEEDQENDLEDLID